MKPLIVVFKSLILFILANFLFIIPLITVIRDLSDPAIQGRGIPKSAVRLHQNMIDPFTQWATDRVTEASATALNINDISGTEWPIFSAVYFLWATEALQIEWEQNPEFAKQAPAIYAADAIEAAARLVADPNHAAWVQRHWGDDYLHQENIFYRMLLISGLSSYERLINNDQYHALLDDQVRTLSQELTDSPHGLLDDYPGQCYPIDILPAIAVIKRTDILDTPVEDAFVQYALRGFSDARLDPLTNLPAYIANSRTGQGVGSARGVGISYMLIWAPELWPDVAADWYSTYEQHFFSKGRLLTGIREFPTVAGRAEWLFDIDAGPVFGGVGTAASAFGIGAARANGRFDHAYPLTAQALAVSWPLPNNTLLIPRLLSNLTDAPFVGETAILFNLTRTSISATETTVSDASLPLAVYVMFLFYTVGGLTLLAAAYKDLRRVINIKSRRR